jgi:hypothetical protein
MNAVARCHPRNGHRLDQSLSPTDRSALRRFLIWPKPTLSSSERKAALMDASKVVSDLRACADGVDALLAENARLRERLRDVRAILIPFAEKYRSLRIGEWGAEARYDTDKVEVSVGALSCAARVLDTF